MTQEVYKFIKLDQKRLRNVASLVRSIRQSLEKLEVRLQDLEKTHNA